LPRSRVDWQEAEVASLRGDPDLIHCVDPFRSQLVTEEPAHFRLHDTDGCYQKDTEDELGQRRAWSELSRQLTCFPTTSR